MPTEYAVAKGANLIGSNDNCFWWLRSPDDMSQRMAATVFENGKILGSGVDDCVRTVRPAMWIDLSKIK